MSTSSNSGSRRLRRHNSMRHSRNSESLSSMIERTSHHHKQQQQQELLHQHRLQRQRTQQQQPRPPQRSNSGRRRELMQTGAIAPNPLVSSISGTANYSSGESHEGTLSVSDGSASLDLANIFYGDNTTVDGGVSAETSTMRAHQRRDMMALQQHQRRQAANADQFRDEGLAGLHSDEFSLDGESRASSDENGAAKNNAHASIAREETQNIGRLRWIVFGLLGLTTILVSFVVYFNTQREETDQFLRAFEIESQTVFHVIRSELEETINAMEQLGVLYTSAAASPAGVQVSSSTPMSWPFVALPNFVIHASSTKHLSNVRLLTMIPIVTDETRSKWQTFAFKTANQDLIASRANDGDENVFETSASAKGGSRKTKSDVSHDRDRSRIRELHRTRMQHQQQQREAAEHGSVVAQERATTAPFARTEPVQHTVDHVAEHTNRRVQSGGQKEPDVNKDRPTLAPSALEAPTGSNNGAVPTKDSITKPPFSSTTASPTLAPIAQPDNGEPALFVDGISTTIYRLEQNRPQRDGVDTRNTGRPIVEMGNLGQYYPVWQTIPTVPGLCQYNVRSDTLYSEELEASIQQGPSVVVGRTHFDDTDLFSQAIVLTETSGNAGNNGRTKSNGNAAAISTQPRLSISVPILEAMPEVTVSIPWVTQLDTGTDISTDTETTVESSEQQKEPGKPVASLLSILHWNDLIGSNLDLHGATEMVLVIETSFRCSGERRDSDANVNTDANRGDLSRISYVISSETNALRFLGYGDRHDNDFDDHRQTTTLFPSNPNTNYATFSQKISYNTTYCPYTMHVYPTQAMNDEYRSNLPLIYTIAVVFTFLFTVGVFIMYDVLVERRQRLVMEKAVQSSAVVSSLFPAVVRDRLFPGGSSSHDLDANVSAKRRLKTFLDEGSRQSHKTSRRSSSSSGDAKPIADLFPYTTVLFADISGFTAWSSVREPSQVFTLLETIYGAFDRIAKKRTVFKVETIGDCYVAVTGLPDPQKDHAVIMAKFAYECMSKMQDLVESLEVKLGPDTGDLSMRLGMHSGPVTAGVLRGEKSRFQLFGDTVNTAARMESTGKAGKIQCSQATAELLIAGNKTHWICPRDEVVQAKGKGKIQTYWINLSRAMDSPFGDSTDSLGSFGSSGFSKRSIAMSVRDMSRSMVWGESTQSNFQELSEVVENHKHQRLIDWNVEILSKLLRKVVSRRKETKSKSSGSFRSPAQIGNGNPIYEVSEAIVMPEFNHKGLKSSRHADSIDLGYAVAFQLKQYVTEIACLYHDDNPFHNFEHASHVTMSANKLLKRVVSQEHVYNRRQSMRKIASNLHNYTYGITSDPLTQFAIVFSALIHDVDHSGVSNMQLIKEKAEPALKYGEKSVAEQNSVDMSWKLLMKDEYRDLQKCIYGNDSEFRRFRSLVVNSVIATDIFDKDLKSFRNNRWDKAFHQGNDDTNLMATIVIEHIIQAADVSHTMQHWHIYTKWNERLFHEMYSAFRNGRGGEKDPSVGWFKGELWFYDNYVIPLAKKLKECNVFGVASAECLNYAMENRREWESKGEKIVEKMVKAYHSGQRSLDRLPSQMEDPDTASSTGISIISAS